MISQTSYSFVYQKLQTIFNIKMPHPEDSKPQEEVFSRKL